jgi:peptidoglycan-associated lipoprotein
MSTILITVVFSFSALFMLASCSKKITTTQSDTPPSTPTEITSEKSTPKAQVSEGPTRSEIAAFESGNIYFDYDRSELKSTAKAALQKKAAWLRANSGFSVKISGHCDERGTNEYNLALGERRANATWKYLNALGVSGNRMNTVSYGEEKPAVPGHNDTAWAKNRRAEFKLMR